MLDIGSTFDGEYSSLEAFYRAAYPETLMEISRPVALGTKLLSARQGAGDYSDAAVPELVLMRVVSREIPATVDLGSGQFRAVWARNSMMLTPPDTPTKIFVDLPHEVEVLAIPYTALHRLCSDHDLPPDGDFGAAHHTQIVCPKLTATFARTAREIRAGNPSGAMFLEGALMQIAGLLTAGEQSRLPAPKGGLAPWQLSRVTDYLYAHTVEPVSLAELATLVGLSVYHFARAFKTSTGIAPHQFHVALRMDRARLLLSRSDQSITDIAMALGYDSSQSFARAFKGFNATSPSRYREISFQRRIFV